MSISSNHQSLLRSMLNKRSTSDSELINIAFSHFDFKVAIFSPLLSPTVSTYPILVISGLV